MSRFEVGKILIITQNAELAFENLEHVLLPKWAPLILQDHLLFLGQTALPREGRHSATPGADLVVIVARVVLSHLAQVVVVAQSDAPVISLVVAAAEPFVETTSAHGWMNTHTHVYTYTCIGE